MEGLSLAAAEGRLAASGFRRVVVEGLPENVDATDRTSFIVTAQTPSSGRREMPGTTVTLVVRAD